MNVNESSPAQALPQVTGRVTWGSGERSSDHVHHSTANGSRGLARAAERTFDTIHTEIDVNLTTGKQEKS